MKTLKLTFSIDFIDLNILMTATQKTSYPIELKLTGLIQWVNDDLYTNFQSIVNFAKIFKY